jgi:hypothetical protein
MKSATRSLLIRNVELTWLGISAIPNKGRSNANCVTEFPINLPMRNVPVGAVWGGDVEAWAFMHSNACWNLQWRPWSLKVPT